MHNAYFEEHLRMAASVIPNLIAHVGLLINVNNLKLYQIWTFFVSVQCLYVYKRRMHATVKTKKLQITIWSFGGRRFVQILEIWK